MTALRAGTESERVCLLWWALVRLPCGRVRRRAQQGVRACGFLHENTHAGGSTCTEWVS